MNTSFLKAFIAQCAADAKAGAARLGRSSKPRIDENLPLGYKIGMRLVFEDMPFDIAMGAGHLVDKKPLAQTIVAYGRGEIASMRFHRYYMSDGVHMLQVVVDSRNQIMAGEVRLMRLHKELFPQSREEWSVWLPVTNDPNEKYQIGYSSFTMPNWPDDKTIHATYPRAWPDFENQAEQVTPVEFEERIYGDPYGDVANMLFRRKTMLYGRSLGEGQPAEWVMLSESERGPRNAPTETTIQVHVGLAIDDLSQMAAAA